MPEHHDRQPENDHPEDNDHEALTSDELRYAPVNDHGNEPDAIPSAPARNTVEPVRRFEDLTLAELIDQFIQAPRQTTRSLLRITRAPRDEDEAAHVPIPTPVVTPVVTPVSVPSPYEKEYTGETDRGRLVTLFSTKLTARQVQLVMYLFAVIVGLIGSAILAASGDVRRTEENALVFGAPYLWIAFFVWLGAELYGNWQSLVQWWGRIDRLTKSRWVLRIVPVFVWLSALLLFTDSMTAPAELALGLVQVGIGRVFLGVILWVLIEIAVLLIRHMAKRDPVTMAEWVDLSTDSRKRPRSRYATEPIWQQITISRVLLFVGAAVSSVLVWIGTPNNQIPLPILLLWFLSAGLWALAFAPLKWSLFDWATRKVDAFRRIDWRANAWVVIAFTLIMILGMGFRFVELDNLPPEMTSDHVEKILDSNRVYNSEYNIFFANNGGREPIQMYLMSVFSTLPGLGFNHHTLKLLAALESMVTLPVLFWMGVELFGKRNRRLGLLVGLLMAGLVAVSYWHVAISRQALRIVLTPTFTALLMIYLSRAMRYNQRSDFIKTALVLGFGLYAYQAVRMLPVVVVIGVVIAMMIRSITWRGRLAYVFNLLVLVFISVMVFLPMLHYSSEDPGHFWRRTAGRLLGDDVITEQLPDGTIIERKATMEEQMAAFNANVPILMSNVRNALLMFNWKGDVGWISGVPNEPAMDIYTGTFLILGLAAWLSLMLRSRDPVIWLIPVMFFIMLLPSALSIAYPLENPSHTRTSGAIPPAYLMAALPMALIVLRFVGSFSKRVGVAIAIIFCGGIILLANQRNTSLYFDRYPPIYIESSYPYSEAGTVLRGFVESGGSYGNAFMIAYPYWWGHRAIGIAAGKPFWPNGVVNLSDVPSMMNIAHLRSGDFELDPNKDLLFFYSPDDEATSLQLKEWFPEGREREIQSYQPDDQYMLYRVPSLGESGFREFIANHDT